MGGLGAKAPRRKLNAKSAPVCHEGRFSSQQLLNDRRLQLLEQHHVSLGGTQVCEAHPVPYTTICASSPRIEF